ncbi:purine and uridine phosphorylase [Annulohypoxylon moriforme]|nr:purine and uridine phosphorylase [Annulohypoxylon moriforme]
MAYLRPEDYSVLWIAPLPIEAQAAIHMLDHTHDGDFPINPGDDYIFEAGEMCGHNIVIATLPLGQEYGTGSAAALASQAKKFFPNLWFGLLVGVAAGLPKLQSTQRRDIRLGDILVSTPDTTNPAAVAYGLGKDMGKDEPELLRQGHILAQTETIVRAAMGSVRLRLLKNPSIFLQYYEKIKDIGHDDGTFVDPGQEHDKLYHNDDNGVDSPVEREPRPSSQRTRVWYGTIGSGDLLMKNATRRDELRDKYDLIGLEMEAAGTLNQIPVGVIRGVCDYADKHKNKEWQPYAAAMAAAYAKAILSRIQRRPDSASYDGSGSNSDDTTRAKSGGGGNIFSGKGNQNVGTGTISFGGSQNIS